MHMDDVMPLMYIDEKGKALKSSLSLSDVNQVLIGLYVDEGFIPSSEILYRVHALIVVFMKNVCILSGVGVWRNSYIGWIVLRRMIALFDILLMI